MRMSDAKTPYVDRPLRDYIDEAASGAPTPGGGSVGALAAALGTTMASMAANFTVGKKKYKDVEPEVKELLEKLGRARGRLLAATQRDTEAYASVGAAYSLPKATDEGKAERKAAIQSALRTAMEPPHEALRAAVDALAGTRRLLDIANRNLITDVGVAALLLEAGARSAWLNVAINLNGIDDEGLVSNTRASCEAALAEAARLARETVEGVDAALAKGAK
jgi:formiminotetrahydrofolate cyclodeaminase